MTSRTDARSDPRVGWTAPHARRITLLCWLLVLTMVATAECAWLLWLQDVWTVVPTVARPAPRPSASAEIAQWATDPAP